MEAQAPPTPSPERDLPTLLRREVRLLESVLFRVLREDAEPGLVADVERLRAATIALREEPTPQRRAEVVDIVASFDLEHAEAVARAFTLYFQLINLAEEHHRIHDLRETGRDEVPLHESIASAVAAVREWEGEAGLTALLERLEITPVLTAHPTEARRRAVVEAVERIAGLIARLDDPRLSRPEEDEIERRLLEEVATLWKTDQLRPQRPTPLDEVRAVMALFDETIFRVAPAVYRALDRALDPDGTGRRPPALRPFLRWGSWVGGDRDGNPSVTPEVTREAAAIQADHVLRGLENVTRRVSRAVSCSDRDTPLSEALLKVLDEDEQVFPDAAEALRTRMGDQSHRRMLILIAERIAATRGGAHGAYARPEELVEDLRLVQRSLEDGGAARLAFGELQHLVWQAQTFGFHLASLEVREHSDVLSRILDELAPGVVEDVNQLNALATQGWREGTAPTTDEASLVLETFRTMADIQGRYGPDACRRYVVSFTRTAADVAAVRALARLAVPDGSLVLDVVPLFESYDALAAAPRIL
ncbi:MAG: phosphoenolpyruvate carboxylase, partial [Actinomycetota bacterium]